MRITILIFAAMNNNIILSHLQPRSPRSARAGFTLVEMLVVISIITIMLSAGAIGLKNLSQSGGVSAAIPIAESVFSHARELAVGKASNARILINADRNNDDKYLRYMVVAYEWEDENGDKKWIAESRGSLLPKGVYFSQKYSLESHSDGVGSIETEQMSLFASIDASAPNQSLSTSYFFYEFNAEGNSLTPGASYVINTGSKAPRKEFARVKSDSINGFGGFIISKQGATSSFRHPDQIGISGRVSAGDEF